jgi:hypothetical protein
MLISFTVDHGLECLLSAAAWTLMLQDTEMIIAYRSVAHRL